MPRPVVEPNVFGQLSGTVSASLLDQNFNALTAITNDSAAGWTNAAVDTGSVNSYVVNLVPPAAGYTNGFFLSFLPLNANTGPSSINVNNLGNIQILSSNGSALTPQVIQVGTLYTLMCINGAMRIISPNASVMVGQILMFGGPSSAIPVSWLACNGSAVSRTQYAALFGVIASTYGAGDGSTTFNLPNFTNRFPTNSGNVGTVGGANTTVLTVANLPSHTHQWIDNGHTHNYTSPGAIVGLQAGGGTFFTQAAAVTGSNNQVVGSIGATGSGTAINNQPAFLSVNFIIRAF
jgi:microcystin-dependent protein